MQPTGLKQFNCNHKKPSPIHYYLRTAAFINQNNYSQNNIVFFINIQNLN